MCTAVVHTCHETVLDSPLNREAAPHESDRPQSRHNNGQPAKGATIIW